MVSQREERPNTQPVPPVVRSETRSRDLGAAAGPRPRLGLLREVATVKHAGPRTLDRISPLLEELRSRPALREMRPGVFYLKSRAFLHFHDDPSGIFADVRLADDFVRFPVTSGSQQADLVGRIDDRLAAIESRATDKRRRQPRRGGRRSSGAT
jgi:hypothetical protein